MAKMLVNGTRFAMQVSCQNFLAQYLLIRFALSRYVASTYVDFAAAILM